MAAAYNLAVPYAQLNERSVSGARRDRVPLRPMLAGRRDRCCASCRCSRRWAGASPAGRRGRDRCARRCASAPFPWRARSGCCATTGARCASHPARPDGYGACPVTYASSWLGCARWTRPAARLNTLLTLPEALAVRPPASHARLLPRDRAGGAARRRHRDPGAIARMCSWASRTPPPQELRRRGLRPVIVPNGVPLPEPAPPARSGGLVIGTLTVCAQGQRPVRRAAERLRARLPDAEFRLIGPLVPGPERAWAEQPDRHRAAPGHRDRLCGRALRRAARVGPRRDPPARRAVRAGGGRGDGGRPAGCRHGGRRAARRGRSRRRRAGPARRPRRAGRGHPRVERGRRAAGRQRSRPAGSAWRAASRSRRRRRACTTRISGRCGPPGHEAPEPAPLRRA